LPKKSATEGLYSSEDASGDPSQRNPVDRSGFKEAFDESEASHTRKIFEIRGIESFFPFWK